MLISTTVPNAKDTPICAARQANKKPFLFKNNFSSLLVPLLQFHKRAFQVFENKVSFEKDRLDEKDPQIGPNKDATEKSNSISLKFIFKFLLKLFNSN